MADMAARVANQSRSDILLNSMKKNDAGVFPLAKTWGLGDEETLDEEHCPGLAGRKWTN